MRKLLIILLTITIGIVTSCISEYPEPTLSLHKDIPIVSESTTTPRSIEEALQIATEATALLSRDIDEVSISRRVPERTIDHTIPVYTVRKTTSRSTNETPLLYVVNYTDNKGFAIVSASRNTPELLAVTEKGHFNPETGTQQTGFQMWYEEMVSTLGNENEWTFDTTGLNTRIPLPGYRSKTVRHKKWIRQIYQRIKVNWGQGDLYNSAYCEGLECPNGSAGCANTAIAMIMSYLEKPTSLQLTYLPSAPTISLDWTELKKYCAITDSTNTYPQSNYPIRLSLSQLLRELGNRAQSIYNPDGSTSTSKSGVHHVLSQLGISQAHLMPGDIAYQELKYSPNVVVLLTGDNKMGKGHIWVCDGLLEYKFEDYYYDSEDSGATWKLVSTIELPGVYKYVHYNWGWNGEYNGYYVPRDYYARTDMTSAGDRGHYFIDNYSLAIRYK